MRALLSTVEGHPVRVKREFAPSKRLPALNPERPGGI
jgi:hypothetical protein